MCFYVNKSQKQIAKKDITVYKIITMNNKSLVYHFSWKPNKTYKENLKTKEQLTYLKDNTTSVWGYSRNLEFEKVINEGFHGFIHIKNAIKLQRRITSFTKIVKMIIPKGSTYYRNKEEIVSNQIKTMSL